MTRSIRRVPDVQYGEVLGFRPLELDLHLPEADGPLPVIVYVHGGGWQRGTRRQPPPLLAADFYDRIAAQGFAVAAIDYRLSGEARFPAALEDVRTAVSWVRDNADVYGLDAGRVFLWGDSAGGHLALLAALTGAAVQGAVAWFPVTDLLGMPSDVADAGGVRDLGPDSREAQFLGAPAASVPDLARQASPVTHAHAEAPPILLLHGTVDDLVPAAQSIRLAEALEAAEAVVELELVPGATHFWKGASDVPAIIRRSIEFLRALALGPASSLPDMTDAHEVVAAYWAAAEVRDWDAFGALLADDVIYRGPQTREQVRGREAYIRFNVEGFAYDWHITVQQIVGEGQHAASWIEFAGPEGSQPGLCFFELGDEGQITRITDFWPDPYELPGSRAHLVERY